MKELKLLIVINNMKRYQSNSDRDQKNVSNIFFIHIKYFKTTNLLAQKVRGRYSRIVYIIHFEQILTHRSAIEQK